MIRIFTRVSFVFLMNVKMGHSSPCYRQRQFKARCLLPLLACFNEWRYRAYDVMVKYFPKLVIGDMLLGHRHVESLEFLRWLMNNEMYTVDELISNTRNHIRLKYLDGDITYKEALP